MLIASEQEAREWLNHPLTLQLKTLLASKQDRVVTELLAGHPANPIRQGEGKGYRLLLTLLSLPPASLISEMREKK